MSCSKRFFNKSIFDWRPFQGIFGFLSSNFGLESSHWNKISYFNSYLRMVKSSLKMVSISYLKFYGYIWYYIWKWFIHNVYYRLLHGHRPYWWIQIKNITNQGLIQTPITCETGPGNPSGHVMINMVIGLTFVKLIESLVYSNGTEGDPIKLMVKRISWNVLYLWILLMVTSRVFILAHFPHQCILAVILGFLCFKLIFNDQTWIYPIWNSTLEKIFMALFLLLSAIFVYVKSDDFIGFDINWSIDLAYTYCQNVSRIYLNYTHIFLLIILKFDIHGKSKMHYFTLVGYTLN